MKIYHNPRCSKSRATLKILEDRGINLEVVEYLKNPPTKSELKKILDMLGKSAKEIIRTGEDAYKEATRGKNLTEDELISLMVKNPILIERPIVIKEKQAVLGRPPENVLTLLS